MASLLQDNPDMTSRTFLEKYEKIHTSENMKVNDTRTENIDATLYKPDTRSTIPQQAVGST